MQSVQAIYLWVITKDGAEAMKYSITRVSSVCEKWKFLFIKMSCFYQCEAVDLKTGEGSIYEGEPKSDKPGVTLTLSDEDMVGLVTGKLNPQQVGVKYLLFFCKKNP